MSGSQKDKLEMLANATKTQYPIRLKNDFEYMSPLQNAITTKTKVDIQYKNNKEELSKRIVEPIGLVFYAFAWHLIAWCELRKDYRDFKIERMMGIKDTGLAFSNQSHISINEYMKQLPVDY